MTLPIATHYFKVENKGISATLFAFDAAAPITLLVVGILASLSILSVSHAGGYATLAVGGGLAVFNIIAWSVFCTRRKKSSESPSESIAYSHTKTSLMPGWDQRVYCSNSQSKRNITNALQKKNPTCPFRWILFFDSHQTVSDLLFGDAGHFDSIFEEIKSSNERIVLFICPQDTEAENRWMSSEHFDSICRAQKKAGELKQSGKLTVIPLSCDESYFLNGIAENNNQFPKKVKKALGLGWF